MVEKEDPGVIMVDEVVSDLGGMCWDLILDICKLRHRKSQVTYPRVQNQML